MASDLNSCSFIGRLGRDPETRYTPSGDAVTSFSIAVGESWKDRDSGEKKETTEWVRCVAWRKLGEICGEYLKKGQQVFINGKMKTRKWQKEGQDHYSTEIIVEQMQMLGGKREGNGPPPHGDDDAPRAGKSPPPAQSKVGSQTTDDDSDIPF